MAPEGKGKPPGPAPKKKRPSYESVSEPKSPVIVPQADMKRLRWKPLRQHELGAISTIWDTVCDVPDELLPVEELVTLFGKLPSNDGAGCRATWTPRDVDTRCSNLSRRTVDNSTSRGRSREREDLRNATHEAERRIEPIANRAVTFEQMVESLEGEKLDPEQLEEHWRNMRPAIIVFAEPRVPQVSDQRPLQACSSSDKSKDLQETAASNEVLGESLANPLSLTSVRPADVPQCSGSEKVPNQKEDFRPVQLTLFAPPHRAVRGPSRGPPQRAVGAPSCGPPQRVPKLRVRQAICQKDSPEMPEQTTEVPRSATLFENLPTPTRVAQTKELQIIGGWERPSKEGALRRLPPATSVAEALETFDGKLVRKKEKQNCGDGDCTSGAKEDAAELKTEDLLKLILDSVCPTVAQHEQLKEAKKSNPGLTLGNIEAYMWEICQVAFYRERLECWLYCHTWEEELRPVKDNLKKFQEIMKCFRSEGLSTLLGLILAVGNYLSGNTAAERAAGFRLDLLKSGWLDGLRDNESSDLRRFVIRIFLVKFRTEAIVLLKDFKPAFENVKRTLEPFEGGLKMNKNIKISLEKSCDEALAVRRAELDARRKKFQGIRQSEGDAQAVWLHEAFDRAQECIDDLQRCRDRAAKEYTELLQWMTFSAPPKNTDNTPSQSLVGIEENKRRTDAFFLFWDDFLIPKERFENRPPQLVRNRLKSAFCDGGVIDVYYFGALWSVEFGGLSRTRASSPLSAHTKGQGKCKARASSATPLARSLSSVRTNFNVTGPIGQDANAQSDSREAEVTRTNSSHGGATSATKS